MDSDEIGQFEKVLLEKYLKVGVLSNTLDRKAAENLTNCALKIGKILDSNLPRIEDFKENIDETIRSATLADVLARGRQLLRSKKCLTDSVEPKSEKNLLSENDDSYQLSDSLQTSLSLSFQSPAVISTKCAQLWLLCLENKKAAGCLADMYCVFVPKLHDLANDISIFAMFHNDIEWLIGGLTRLSMEVGTEKEAQFETFKVHHKLETKLEQITLKHVVRIQVSYTLFWM